MENMETYCYERGPHDLPVPAELYLESLVGKRYDELRSMLAGQGLHVETIKTASGQAHRATGNLIGVPVALLIENSGRAVDMNGIYGPKDCEQIVSERWNSMSEADVREYRLRSERMLRN